MRQRIMLLCVLSGMAWPGAAPAETIYQFAFDRSNYTVAPGEKVNVKLYWEENQGILDPGGGIGMYGLGATIRFDDPPQPAALAKVAALSDIAYNPAFDDTSSLKKNVAGAYARLAESTSAFPGNVYGDVVSGDLRRVWVGTFSFTGASTPGVTRIRAGRYQLTTEGDYLVDDAFNAWDASTLEATATVTTVPEPGTLVLLAAGIAALALRRRSRRDEASFKKQSSPTLRH